MPSISRQRYTIRRSCTAKFGLVVLIVFLCAQVYLYDQLQDPKETALNDAIHVVADGNSEEESEEKDENPSEVTEILNGREPENYERKKHLFFFHVSIPVWDFKGSDARLMRIFEAILAEGHSIDIASWEVEHSKQYHIDVLQKMRIVTYPAISGNGEDLQTILKQRHIDIAVFSLSISPSYWDWLESCMETVKAMSPDIEIVVLSDDSHWYRVFELTQQNVELGSELTDSHWQSLKERERKFYEAADFVAAITEHDQLMHQELVPLKRSGILRYVAGSPIVNSPLPYEKRRHILFVGYDNIMNRQSLNWFVTEVWPRLKQDDRMRNTELHVVGTIICELCHKDDHIIMHGQVTQESLGDILSQVLVFISPTVDGTGLNSKNILAMTNGVPLVTTSAGSQGLHLGSTSQSACSVCEMFDAECFEKAVVKIIMDKDVWNDMSKMSSIHVQREFSMDALRQDVRNMVDELYSMGSSAEQISINKEKYFLTAAFFNNKVVFPTFFLRLLKLTEILGRENVYISIYESGSSDNTPMLIEKAKSILEKRSISHSLVSERNIDGSLYFSNRAAFMADLRNTAIKRLYKTYSHVIVFNDALFEPEDIIKLIETPVDYDMVCSMDFSHASWQIYPDLRIDEEEDAGLRFQGASATLDLRGSLMTSRAPYALDPRSRALMKKGQPVPVYSCWNGVIIFRSEIWTKYGLRFRAARGDECQSSECQTWCKDMWAIGFNKIFINPQVRVAYESSVLRMAQQMPWEGVSNPPLPLNGLEKKFLVEKRIEPKRAVCCSYVENGDVDWGRCHWERLKQYSHSEVKTVVFEGQLFETHSYSHVNRELIVRLVRDPHIDLVVVVLPADEKFLLKSAFRHSSVLASAIPLNRLPITADVVIRNFWPPNWEKDDERYGESCSLVVMQPWEFGSIPLDWKNRLGGVSKIIVPSNYVKQMYLRSGVPDNQVIVLHHGVDFQNFTPYEKPYEGISCNGTSTFKFLFHGALLPRKGIDVLMESFVSAFQPDDPVCLVLHTTYEHGDESYLSILEGQIGDAMRKGYQIQWLRRTLLRDYELAGLYTAVDAFVLPYRAEGFGLPIIEAMASQLPVIVTDGGAATDFVNRNEGYLVKSTEQPCTMFPCADDAKGICVFCENIGCECVPLAGNAYWMEPSVEDLTVKMKQVFKNPVDRKERAIRGRMHAMKMSWNAIYEQLFSLILDLDR